MDVDAIRARCAEVVEAVRAIQGFKIWNVQHWQKFNGKTYREWEQTLSLALSRYDAATGPVKT